MLRQLGCESRSLQSVLSDASFPIIARPVGSHAGNGLLKLEDSSAIVDYLAKVTGDSFYISRFVDYRSVDGLFRKYRIALIAGRPYLCHMAIAEHWMLHYLNAGMHEDSSKRAEEARAMATFDHDFAVRHDANLRDLADAIELDYFAIDCGETRDGKLVVFEAGTAMIIHKMDPPETFAYKHPQMQKVCNAFTAMLAASACQASLDA
jgi:glutathione synthase/RimK-type ligase-like ATP-grasp enzyme